MKRTCWSDFCAGVWRRYADDWASLRAEWRQECEQWRDLRTQIRQDRQRNRRMKQRITGLDNPTRRQWRQAARQLAAEADELRAIEHRVLREYREQRQ